LSPDTRLGSIVIRIILIAVLLGCPLSYASGSSERHHHTGICDASGVVAISDNEFAVADDELNRLVVYALHTSGPEQSSLELSDFLELHKKANKNKDEPPKTPKEADLEGATRIGDVIYWISSHGRNRKGKKARGRMQFFATRIHNNGAKRVLLPYGTSYTRLLEDLVAAPQHQAFNLDLAATLPPKAPGGLNIEAVTDMPNGHLLIGFRSPTIAGKSLVIELKNPADIIAGQPALFGHPRLIKLDGGIRAMASQGERYLIIGNELDAEAGQSSLFLWDGESAGVEKVRNLTFPDFNPEAIAVFPDEKGGQVLLLSDDGVRNVDETRCKDIIDREQRYFRSVLYRHPQLQFFH
jgi:hypothetical protein